MDIELSIVMPCLNEAETLEKCIEKAEFFFKNNDVIGEIIVADNGSNDGSHEIANRKMVRLIHVEEKGYGAAILGGIVEAKGKYIIMGDADDSYDFSQLQVFIGKLREGYDLVMGNRFKGGIEPGAMPLLHKYLGNPVLTWIGRLFFNSPVKDFHCGLRGYRRDAINKLNLKTTGMEFASEMVVKATLNNLKVTEVPTTLSKDGRSRAPHLRTWRDGWRHLRFLLLFSPRWLFFYPGLFLMGGGAILMLLLFGETRQVMGVAFGVHTMMYGSLSTVVGFQLISFALLSKVYAHSISLVPINKKMSTLIDSLTVEKGLALGLGGITMGLFGTYYALEKWSSGAFGALDPVVMMRIVIPSSTAITLGVMTVFLSFFINVLKIPHK